MRRKKHNITTVSTNLTRGSSLSGSSATKFVKEEQKVPDWIKFSNIMCKFDGRCTREGCWYMHTQKPNFTTNQDGKFSDFSVFLKNLPLCTTFEERLDLSNYVKSIAKSFGDVTKCLVHSSHSDSKSSSGNVHFKTARSAEDFIDYFHLKYLNGHTIHAIWNGECKYCVPTPTAPSTSTSSTSKDLDKDNALLRTERIKKIVTDSNGFIFAGKNGKKVVFESDVSDSDESDGGLQLELNGCDFGDDKLSSV